MIRNSAFGKTKPNRLSIACARCYSFGCEYCIRTFNYESIECANEGLSPNVAIGFRIEESTKDQATQSRPNAGKYRDRPLAVDT